MHNPIYLLHRACGGGGSEADGGSLLSPFPTAGCHGLTVFSKPCLLFLFPLFLSLFLLTGCVERRIRVTSSPAGARVWVNDQHIGTTPVETRFTFYGGYDVRVELDGYESINELRQAKAPLYEYPGPDLIATALPYKFKNTVEWHFDLDQVAEAIDPQQARIDLLLRADELRRQALTALND